MVGEIAFSVKCSSELPTTPAANWSHGPGPQSRCLLFVPSPQPQSVTPLLRPDLTLALGPFLNQPPPASIHDHRAFPTFVFFITSLRIDLDGINSSSSRTRHFSSTSSLCSPSARHLSIPPRCPEFVSISIHPRPSHPRDHDPHPSHISFPGDQLQPLSTEILTSPAPSALHAFDNLKSKLKAAFKKKDKADQPADKPAEAAAPAAEAPKPDATPAAGEATATEAAPAPAPAAAPETAGMSR